MIVVADTAPLNYLVQLECVQFLPVLYGRVLIPHAVVAELSDPNAPPAVSAWIANLPSWVEVRTVQGDADELLRALDPREREAIMLAETIPDGILLMDDEDGRREALRRKVRTTGTLGVLVAGAELDIFDGEEAFHRLLATMNFRISSRIRRTFEAKFETLQKRRRP